MWKKNKNHTNNAVKSVIAKSKKKKRTEFFGLSFKCRKKTNEKLREVNFRGGSRVFAEWVYFCFYTKLTGFWCHTQHCMFSLKGTNCAVNHRGSFGTDFRQVQQNMKSESIRQPPQAFTTGSHLLPVSPHHCESSEGEARYISIAKNGLSVMSRYQLLLLIINGRFLWRLSNFTLQVTLKLGFVIHWISEIGKVQFGEFKMVTCYGFSMPN